MAAKRNTKLTVVSDEVYHLDRKPETPAQRIRRLQDEARLLAREQITTLEKSMKSLAKDAEEIATGGDACPAGVREIASRMAEDIYAKMETVQSLMARSPMPKAR